MSFTAHIFSYKIRNRKAKKVSQTQRKHRYHALFDCSIHMQCYLGERQEALVSVGKLSDLCGETHVRTGVHQVLGLVCKLVNNGLVGQDLLALFLKDTHIRE